MKMCQLVKKQIYEIKTQFNQKDQHLNEMKQATNQIAQLED